MSHAPSLRQIREAIEAHARAGAADDVALASIRQDIEQMRESMRTAVDRARDFANRGLVSEAASVVDDYPELARQVDALLALPRSSAAVARFWQEHVDSMDETAWMPAADDVDSLLRVTEQAARLRPLLDALRTAALRRESIGNRLVLLKKLREAEPQNRLWLDQIDALEREWIKRIGEMRSDPAADREELEEAFTALATRQWIAPVPRGLKEEIYARVKPMRAEAAGDRYAELVGKIHDAAALMDRTELEKLEAEWAQVFHETGRMPDESAQQSVASAFDWLGRVAAEERAQADFEGRVEQLERLLDARASVVEIERQLTQLRDGGRSAPEGVLARASGYIAAERDRLRRRHRLVLAGSLVAAAVFVSAGVAAITAYTRAKDRESAALALRSLLDSGSVLEAHALANQIRATPELDSPEVSAQLVREEQAIGQWNVERAAVKEELAVLGTELQGTLARARLKQIAGEITAIAARAKLEEERAAAEQLARKHADLERVRDDADAKLVDAGLGRLDESLRPWPLPDRWTPGESIDLARWDSYLGALDRAKGDVDRLLLEVAGSDIQESRLKTRGDGIAARLGEARARRTELATDLAALAPAKLGAPVSVEADLVDRLQSALTKHGATLRRGGQDGAFESSQRLAPGWTSIQVWRDAVWPKVELAMGKPADADANAALLQALTQYLADHSKSPYRARIEELIRRIDPAAQVPIWWPERVRGALADHFYAGLEEVPLASGDRFIYRRPSPADRDPLHRAVENLADVIANPDRLNAYLLTGGDRLLGGTRSCAVSIEWGRLEQALANCDATEVQGLILDMLERLRTMQQGEVLFRVRALRDLAVVFKQSGHVPVAAEKPLEEWLTRSSRLWTDALAADWALAAHSAPANIRALRTEAASAIGEFPKLVVIAEEAKAERRRAKDGLRPLAPIGVLLPAPTVGAPRELGEARPDGPVVLVASGPVGFRFVDAQLVGNQVKAGDEIPAGPVLVFRRTGS